jgi:hypothetical protein
MMIASLLNKSWRLMMMRKRILPRDSCMQLISDSLPSVGRSLVKLERKTEYHIAKLAKIEDVLKEKISQDSV